MHKSTVPHRSRSPSCTSTHGGGAAGQRAAVLGAERHDGSGYEPNQPTMAHLVTQRRPRITPLFIHPLRNKVGLRRPGLAQATAQKAVLMMGQRILQCGSGLSFETQAVGVD